MGFSIRSELASYARLKRRCYFLFVISYGGLLAGLTYAAMTHQSPPLWIGLIPGAALSVPLLLLPTQSWLPCLFHVLLGVVFAPIICARREADLSLIEAVELGAVEIWPLESARCVVKVDGKSAPKKVARLQKIAREAAMQSGRGVIPQVLAPASLKQALEEAARQGEILFFYERGEESLRQALRAAGERLFVFVGPEGGFAPEEAALAQSLGAKLLTLGPRILRTETAPLAALSAIFYEKGDMERRGEAT